MQQTSKPDWEHRMFISECRRNINESQFSMDWRFEGGQINQATYMDAQFCFRAARDAVDYLEEHLGFPPEKRLPKWDYGLSEVV